MRAPVPVGGRELHTSVSIGITEVAPDADPDECLAQADAAMYQAKRSGPARFEVYDAPIGDDARRESQLADELRVAHAKGELTLDYQPIFQLAGGRPSRLVGMEALLRWAHPDLGSVPPAEFVPLLEQSRQIVQVGRWVLEEAAFQCRDWQAQGFPDLTVSVNVSARQLQDPGFFDDVQDALDASGLDPEHLVLEVTESVLVVDILQIGAMMQRVRELGIHLALDDFGTGYSSLLYLQGLPIDRLKIDRCFVSGLDADDHDGTIIQTVVDLAHRLGITVVAEGVETPAELRAVGALGCDEAQGFLLGRPAAGHLHALDRTARVPSLPSDGRRRRGRTGRGAPVSRPAGRTCASGPRRGGGIRRPAGRTRRPPPGRAGGWRPRAPADGPRPGRRPRGTARRSVPRRAGWRAGVRHLLDGAVEDVGVDRAPQRRRGPAADGPDGAERAGRRTARRLGPASGELRATPSSTERTRSARVVRSDRLWNPPRARRSSTGERSPASHGVNSTRPLPGAAVAASAVSSSKGVGRTASSPSRQSRSHSSARPPDSWLLATRRSPGRIPGTVAI